jgi:hypothetical protein
MNQLNDKDYQDYILYKTDLLYSRILTPDALRLLCEGLDRDPIAIGEHILETYTKLCASGFFEKSR